jgi:Flp pilus assembly pilin Flp
MGETEMLARILNDHRGAKAMELGLTAALVSLAGLTAMLTVALT